MESNVRKVHSSLPLQMCIHYHLYLMPFILVSQLYCFYIKYDYIHPIYQVVLTAVHLISVLVELIRPYLGYYGNLGEQIPALTGYCTVSLILQIPIILFLTFNEAIIPLPLERVVYIIHLCFLFAEVIIGTVLIRRLANVQMKLFKEKLDADAEPEIKKKSS